MLVDFIRKCSLQNIQETIRTQKISFLSLFTRLKIPSSKALFAFDSQGTGRSHSPQIDQKRVLQPLHDLELSEDVADLVPLDALLLAHVLHRVHFLRVPLLHDAYLGNSQWGEHSGQHRQ